MNDTIPRTVADAIRTKTTNQMTTHNNESSVRGARRATAATATTSNTFKKAQNSNTITRMAASHEKAANSRRSIYYSVCCARACVQKTNGDSTPSRMRDRARSLPFWRCVYKFAWWRATRATTCVSTKRTVWPIRVVYARTLIAQ